MNFEFKCPQCGKPLSADESYRGKVIECPYCTRGIVVPKNKMNSVVQRQATSHQPTMQRSEQPRQYVWCNGMIFDCSSPSSGSSSTPESVNTPESAETYICTHCGESMPKPKTIHPMFGCACMIGTVIGSFIIFIVFSPLIGIIYFLITFLGSLFMLRSALSKDAMYCPKCHKRGTLISGSSPRGIRMLKETQLVNDTVRPPQLTPPPPPVTEPISQDVSERLNKIRKLLDGGLISAEEYEAQRKRILESI